MIRRWDVIIIGIVLLSGLALWWFLRPASADPGTGSVEIYVNGKLFETADLSADREIPVQSGKGRNLVRIRDGRVSMAEANCPDKICLRSGAKSGAGGMIVCLPNRIVVKIPETLNEVDAVAW